MTRNKALVSRYARAFMEYCRCGGSLESALSNLKQARQLLRDSAELFQVFQSPQVSPLDKFELVNTVFGAEFSDELRHFLKVLIENKREEYFFDIAAFALINYSHEGKEEALIKTSFPLDLDLIARIQSVIQEKFNREFKFYLELDGSLLGGIQVIIGNTIIDGSMRKRLQDLKDRLKSI